MKLAILVALAFFAKAEIFSFSTSSTSRKLINLKDFTFGAEGDFYIKMEKIDSTANEDNNYAGFVLMPSVYSTDDLCTLSLTGQTSNAVKRGYFFYQLKTEAKHQIVPKGTYRLVYFSCGEKRASAFSAKIFQGYRIESDYHYLTYGELPMISISQVLSAILLIGVLYDLYLVYFREIHTVQTLILGFGVIVLLNLCFDVLTLKTTDAQGISSLRYFDYIFRIIETISFYVVTILVATGWSRKNKFDFNQKKLLVFFIVLQLLSNILYLVSKENEIARTRVTGILMVIDVICSIAILFPLVKTLNILKKTSGVNVKTLKQYQRFSRCYSLLLIIAYFKVLIAYVSDTTPSSDNDFIYLAVDKSLYVIYALYLIIAFRPKKLYHSPQQNENGSVADGTVVDEERLVEKQTTIDNEENQGVKNVVLVDNGDEETTNHKKTDIVVELE